MTVSKMSKLNLQSLIKNNKVNQFNNLKTFLKRLFKKKKKLLKPKNNQFKTKRKKLNR